MTVQAECRNILRYDKDAGQYVYCGCVVTAADDKIGTTVECPDCGAPVEILPQEPQHIHPPQDDVLEDVSVESNQALWKYEPPAEMAPEFVRTQIPCINCHTPIPLSARSCPECGYEQPDDEAPGPTGFQLWVQSGLTEDTSPLMIIGIGAAFLCVFGAICLGFTVTQIGKTAAVCLVSPFVLMLVLVSIILVAGRKSSESLIDAGRRIFDPISLILHLYRAMSWREITIPFRSRRFLDRRNLPFNDQNLLEDKDLDTYEALDLEGTQITDNGLDYLISAKALKFVVVRRTQTTAGGVRRLQNRRPHIWIWT